MVDGTTAELSPDEAATPPESASRARKGGRLSAYYELTKPGIATFVMMTAGVGYYLAAGRDISIAILAHTLFGSLLGTSGALALNQWIERDIDARMVRTRNRPIPSGRLTSREALLFGVAVAAAGIGHLWYHVGLLPAFLTLLSAIVYLGVYTPLKRHSYLTTFAGAFPGSAPALIGWSAADPSLPLPALAFFATMFIWQLPHVITLAWLLQEDYAAAGFYIIPTKTPDGGRRWTGNQLVLWQGMMIPVSLSLTPLGVTGAIYFFGALAVGLFFFRWAWIARRTMDRDSVRRLFFGSLAHHPILLVLMVIDAVR